MAGRKDDYFQVRCSIAEKEDYQEEARLLGLSFSEFVRRSCKNTQSLKLAEILRQHRLNACKQIEILEQAKLEAQESGNGRLQDLIGQAQKISATFLQ